MPVTEVVLHFFFVQNAYLPYYLSLMSSVTALIVSCF